MCGQKKIEKFHCGKWEKEQAGDELKRKKTGKDYFLFVKTH